MRVCLSFLHLLRRETHPLNFLFAALQIADDLLYCEQPRNAFS